MFYASSPIGPSFPYKLSFRGGVIISPIVNPRPEIPPAESPSYQELTFYAIIYFAIINLYLFISPQKRYAFRLKSGRIKYRAVL